MKNHNELKVEIYYLSTKEGGRTKPLFNGYRAQIHYDGKDWSAQQSFIETEICALGESVQAYLNTLSPLAHVGKFYIGQEFEIREGSKTIGKAKVLEVIRKDFQFWEKHQIFHQLNESNTGHLSQEKVERLAQVFKESLFPLKHFTAIKTSVTKKHHGCFLEIMCIKTKKNFSLKDINDYLTILRNKIFLENKVYKAYYETEGEVIEFITWDKDFFSGNLSIK
jgi:hypothetical protein